jgi:hypothetical protein
MAPGSQRLFSFARSARDSVFVMSHSMPACEPKLLTHAMAAAGVPARYFLRPTSYPYCWYHSWGCEVFEPTRVSLAPCEGTHVPVIYLRVSCSPLKSFWPLQVADFGLSKVMGNLSLLPGTKTLTGTPQYLAPEANRLPKRVELCLHLRLTVRI